MEHTREPWKYGKELSASAGEWLISVDAGSCWRGNPIAETRPATGDEQANARRIVACVNACAGVTTKELEQGGFVAGLIERLERLTDAMQDFVNDGYNRERAIYELKMVDALKVGAGDTAEPNCDRSACGDFKPGPCDHPDCPAIGKAPDDMIAMENAQGKKFALKLNPAHPQHGWIFYDNHGQWVTLRRALPHEIERAKAIIEMREVLANVPCRA